MRISIIVLVLSIVALLPMAGFTAEDATVAPMVYETSQLRFTIPDGWKAEEIEPGALVDLQSFDAKLQRSPIGVVAADDAVGLMILMSGRGDSADTFFDYMLLKQWSKLDIYKLFEGKYVFTDKTGKERKCSLTINAIDDGQSTVLISHDIILFVGDTRYEFAYIADADKYAVNFGDVETVLSSLEFL